MIYEFWLWKTVGSEIENTGATFDAHNRNTAWSYDADGRLISMNEPPSTTSFTFRTNPGHVFSGTISFSASDVGSGRVNVSVKAQGDLGDTTAWALYHAGAGSFEDDVWKNFLDNAQRSCGSLK
jgi:YD repeat-containing protein